ncbi:MAG TPA: DUF2157 domain-containing protein [Methylomirabilota bacterium]|nr:DUF2157 domain-containing protein [Methylomirabilota bacterium]
MVNPDVVGAIARLRAEGVLSSVQAARFERVARRGLVSLRFEIRALLYAGVLLVTAGVGSLIARHQQEIGPVAIALGVGLAALGCLAWVGRRAAPFSWGPVPSPGVAFDYVLLLGLLLAAADLAYVEAQFAILGPRWPRHLVVVAALDLLAAYTWDSRTALGLALTSLAAWRGVVVGLAPALLGPGIAADLRANAIALGALSLAVAVASARLGRKPHFESVYAPAGLLLLLGGLLGGTLYDAQAWTLWLLATLIVAGLVMVVAVRLRRSLYFALGVPAAYVALVRLLFEPFRYGSHADSLPLLLSAGLGAGVLALILAVHRRVREE